MAAILYFQWINIGQSQVLFSETFESGGQGWTIQNQQVFQIGVPVPGIGPGSGHLSSNCAGTNLSGNYPTNSNTRLVSPIIALPNVNNGEKILFRFWQWFEIFFPTAVGQIQISQDNGQSWQNLSTPLTGTINGGAWTQHIIDLTQFTNSSIRLGFYFTSTINSTDAGWYIDDVSIEVKVPVFNITEGFESGIGDWSAQHGVWEAGIPTSGPLKPHSGNQCLATVLDGDYPRNSNSRIISPAFTVPVPGLDEQILLRYWQWISFYFSDAHGWVQISTNDGADWQTISSPLVGPINGGVWSQNIVDLTAFAGKSVRLSFLFISVEHTTASGWYIDDISIESKKTLSSILEGFESGGKDWSADQGVWAVGIPTSGPLKAHTGDQCLATILDGDYPKNANSRIASPIITLPSVESNEKILLRFWEWMAIYFVTAEGLIQISQDNGTSWQTVSAPLTGTLYGGVWTQHIVDLTPFAGTSIRIGFYFKSTINTTAAGWYIDDISIEVKEPDFNNPEGFEPGISDWSVEHGLWEAGVPTSGPGTAYSGKQCIATVLNGNHTNYAASRLISPQFTITSLDDSLPRSFSFRHWWKFGGNAKGEVQVSINKGSWITLKSYTGSGNSWQKDSFSLSSYQDSLIRIAFFFTAFNSSTAPGWYIDDITFNGTCYEKNVGILGILSPAGIFPPDTTLIPSAIVKNYGSETAVFPLTFQIGSEYTYDSIVALQPNQKDTIYFPPWSPAQKGTFIAKCRADWANDYCPENNEKTANVTITPGNEPIITAIFPTQGGNTGAVTTEITGKFFQAGARAFLKKGGIEIEAYDLDWVNAEKLFASFNLMGKEIGFYDVEVRNPDTQQAIFKDGFEIVDGSIGWTGVASSACAPSGFDVGQLLEIEIIRPSSTRSNWIVPMTIRYRNTGNIDIPLPTRVLVSLSGAPVAFTEAGLSEKKTEMFLELKEAGGPTNVLRAGAGGSILVYTKSPPTSQTLQFKLLE